MADVGQISGLNQPVQPVQFKGRENGGGTSPIAAGLGTGLLTGGAVYAFAKSAPTQDEFTSSIKAGKELKFATELTDAEKKTLAGLKTAAEKEAKAAEGAKGTTKAATTVTSSDKDLTKEINKIFGAKGTEKTPKQLLGHIPVKNYEANLKVDEKALATQQKAFEELSAKHDAKSARLDQFTESLTKEAKDSIKNDEIDDKGAKLVENEKKKADTALTSAKKAEADAKTAASDAEKEATAAESKAKATPTDKALQADAAKKRKTADSKAATYVEKQTATAEKQAVLDLKTVEAKTARTKATALKAEGDSAIARDLANRNPGDVKLEAAAKKAEADFATAKTAVKTQNAAEITYKTAEKTKAKTAFDKSKTALETAEKDLNSDILKVETKKARLSLAKGAIDSNSKTVTREAFETELKTGVTKAETVAKKLASPFEKAFAEFGPKLAKISSIKKAGIYGGIVALGVGLLVAMTGGKKEAPEA